MLITSKQAVEQALANVRLESLDVSEKVALLLQQALKDKNVDTNDILKLLRSE